MKSKVVRYGGDWATAPLTFFFFFLNFHKLPHKHCRMMDFEVVKLDLTVK